MGYLGFGLRHVQVAWLGLCYPPKWGLFKCGGAARICVLYTHLFCGELRAMEILCILIIVLFFIHADLFPHHASVRDDLLSSAVRTSSAHRG